MKKEKTDVMALYILDIGTESPENLVRNIWDDLNFLESIDEESYGLDVIVRPREGYSDFDADGNGLQPIVYVIMAGYTDTARKPVDAEIKRFEEYMENKYSIVNNIISIRQQ